MLDHLNRLGQLRAVLSNAVIWWGRDARPLSDQLEAAFACGLDDAIARCVALRDDLAERGLRGDAGAARLGALIRAATTETDAEWSAAITRYAAVWCVPVERWVDRGDWRPRFFRDLEWRW